MNHDDTVLVRACVRSRLPEERRIGWQFIIDFGSCIANGASQDLELRSDELAAIVEDPMRLRIFIGYERIVAGNDH